MAEGIDETSGSKQRVALDLLQYIQNLRGAQIVKNEDEILELYVRCLRVTSGNLHKRG